MLPLLDAFEYAAQSKLPDGAIIHCTFRSYSEQAILFRQGRSIAAIREKARQLDELYGRLDLHDILFDVGPQYGDRIVTNAGPGQSLHNYGYAWDGCPLWNGKLIYDDKEHNRVPDPIEDELWKAYGECAREAGLEWAGDWKRFREMPHCQMPHTDWRELIRG